ncbi:alpha-glucan phosphorylase, partial [mine drainage metagenome]
KRLDFTVCDRSQSTVMRKSLIEVVPVIPEALARLPELAGNLFFSWHRPARALFEDLDPELWNQCRGNPRLMLRCLPQRALDAAAGDPQYLGRYTAAMQRLDAYLAARPHGPASRWSPISAPSTAFTRASRSTREASASWPETIAKPQATPARISWP